MNSNQRLKLIGYFMIAVMVLNVILFSFRIINVAVFWAVIIIGFIFVWKVIPILKKRNTF